QAAAILVDGAANQGNGLINIKDANLASGGIKVTGSTDIYIDNVIEEGDFVHDMPPVIWFTGWSTTSIAYLNHVEGADFGPTPTPCIEVDNSNVPIQSGGPVVINSNCGILGPATVLNTTQNAYLNGAISNATPLRQGQLGFWSNSIVGQT